MCGRRGTTRETIDGFDAPYVAPRRAKLSLTPQSEVNIGGSYSSSGVFRGPATRVMHLCFAGASDASSRLCLVP